MEIIVEQKQARVPVTILRLTDRVNLGNTTQIEAKAREVFEQGCRDLLVDLTGVPSMTSAGFRTLLVIYKLYEHKDYVTGKATGKAVHFKLLNPSAEVRRVLGLVGYDMYLAIHENEQDALNDF